MPVIPIAHGTLQTLQAGRAADDAGVGVDRRVDGLFGHHACAIVSAAVGVATGSASSAAHPA